MALTRAGKARLAAGRLDWQLRQAHPSLQVCKATVTIHKSCVRSWACTCISAPCTFQARCQPAFGHSYFVNSQRRLDIQSSEVSTGSVTFRGLTLLRELHMKLASTSLHVQLHSRQAASPIGNLSSSRHTTPSIAAAASHRHALRTLNSAALTGVSHRGSMSMRCAAAASGSQQKSSEKYERLDGVKVLNRWKCHSHGCAPPATLMQRSA